MAVVETMENEFSNDDITKCSLTSKNFLYSTIPFGHFKCSFTHPNMESGNLSIKKDEETNESSSLSTVVMVCNYNWMNVCGMCCQKTIQLDLKSLSIKVQRKPLYSRDGNIGLCCLLLVRDGLVSFVLAFLFHLVPSVIWGPENALGSSRNHAAMGIVWFVSWPIIACVLQCLRPYGIQFEGYNPYHKNHPKKNTIFVSYPSKKYALDIQTWMETAKEKYNTTTQQQQNQKNNHRIIHVPPLPQTNKWDYVPMIIRCIIFVFLIIHMFVTFYLVQQCTNRGCCKDDEDTLTSCRDTGYP